MSSLKKLIFIFITSSYLLVFPAKLHAQPSTPVQQSLMMQSLGSDAQRTQFLLTQYLFSEMGPTMQHLASITFVGGRLQKEQQQVLFHATGGRIGHFRASLVRFRDVSGLSKDDPQWISAEEEVFKLHDFLVAHIASSQFARTVMIVKDPTVKELLMQVRNKQ